MIEDIAPTQAPLTMEEKILAARRQLLEDPINKAGFQRRYRPDLERMESTYIVYGLDGVALRRFVIAGRVYELVEFLIDGATDCVLFINFQTQKILEYSRYVDAEVTLVDQIQTDTEKIGGRQQ